VRFDAVKWLPRVDTAAPDARVTAADRQDDGSFLVRRTDAERNCVSNIRPEGLGYEAAAARLHYLMTEARRRKLSGVALKDETGVLQG
jgi:hypothetical protein